MNVALLKFLLYDSILLGGNGMIDLIANNNWNKTGPCLKVTIVVFSRGSLSYVLQKAA